MNGARETVSAPALAVLVRARHVYRTPGEPTSLFAARSQVMPGGHASAFARAVEEGLPEALVDDGATWQLRTPPIGVIEALTGAVSAQLAARTAPRASLEEVVAPLQAVVLVGLPEELADPEEAWAGPLEVTGAVGGQVLVTAAAARVLEGLPIARFYQWEARGRKAEYYECIYDDRLTLLDPPFERMFSTEVAEWVAPRRLAQASYGYGRGPLKSPTRPSVENDLYGIALSGGGMRSATFSLGVLQALSRYDLLEPADYLSTVSGGGYVGISFAGLCADDLPYQGLSRLGSRYDQFPFSYPRGRLDDPMFGASDESSVPVHGNETPALWHVRKYANLLGGGIGLFNLATWQAFGRYLVSTVALWLLFLIPIVGSVVITGVAIAYAGWNWVPRIWSAADQPWLLPVLAIAPLLLIAWMALARTLAGRARLARSSDEPFPERTSRTRRARIVLALLASTLLTASIALLASGIFRVLTEQTYPDLGPAADATDAWWIRRPLAVAVPAMVFGAFVTLGFSTVGLKRHQIVAALVFLLFPTPLLLSPYLNGESAAWLMPVFFLGIIAAGLCAAQAIRTAGPVWAPRLLRTLASIAAVLLIALIIGGCVWLYVAGRPMLGLDEEATRTWLRRLFVAVSSVSSIAVAIGLPRMSTREGGSFISRLVFGLGGYVVLFSLGILAAWGFWTLFARTDNDWVAPALVAFFAITLVFPLWLGTDRATLLNALSLSGLYEDRLQQTWMIGARPSHRVEDASHHMTDTVARWHSVWARPERTVTQLRGSGTPTVPYPIICATLNIPGSRGDKLPERKADSFVIAPLFSGSAMSRWSPSSALEGFRSMTLARAASISGAAVSPNMGEKTSRTLSVLTTIFNVRIGRWMPNPRRSRQRGHVLRCLNALPAVLYVRELLGIASREDEFVYLSDGGHFENLGVYELFRRRCRYIVAVSADIESIEGTDAMGNLGTALRMARVDFGVEVHLPSLKPLLRNQETGRVLSYFAVGEIRYPSAVPDGAPAETGTFVLIKTGLVEESMTADLMQYLAGNPAFPYDSTLDQQYDQPQFESYRHLGYLAGRTMCRKASTWPEGAGPPPEGWPQPLAARFRALRHEFEETPAPLTDIARVLQAIREEFARDREPSAARDETAGVE